MQVVATGIGVDGKGHRREIGEVFPCPKNPQGQEIVKASWYAEHKPESQPSKGGKNLVG